MTQATELSSLSDDQLLHRLAELLQESRRVEADLVAHIGEVDERRLYAREASPSMFDYCTRVLHLSEAATFLRIRAARAARRYPALIAMLRDGRLHLTGIGLVAPHLTNENCETILSRAAHQSKREIEELLAELAPKPDAPERIRKLPGPPVRPSTSIEAPSPAPQLRPDAVARPRRPDTSQEKPPFPVPPPPKKGAVEPLAPARYKVTFTATAGFRDKLERLRALLRPAIPNGDLAAILEEAVTEKLDRLEARRYGTTTAERKKVDEVRTDGSSRYIPAPVRRKVRKRDGDRCTFVDRHGRRCPERRALEFHHRNPYGRGGDHSEENVALLCKAHNTYLAECDYGRETMERHRRGSSRVRERSPSYGRASAPTPSRGATASGRSYGRRQSPRSR